MNFHSDWQLYLAAFAIAIFTSLGGLWLAAKRPRWAGSTELQLFIALGTGMLLAVDVLEFFPQAFSTGNQWTGIYVIAGLFFVIFTEKYLAHRLDFLEAP